MATTRDKQTGPASWTDLISSSLRASALALGALTALAPQPTGAATEGGTVHIVAVGETLPALTLPDQKGVPQTVGGEVRLLLISHDMDGGAFVKEALAEDGAARLSKAHAVYIADMGRMPGFVRSMFALPSMKKRPYPVLLDEEGKACLSLPTSDKHATLLALDHGKVVSVTFATSAADVRSALDAASR